ncbi:unnamed protein product [Ilex paraguariensis]|uniref:Uncharacterized protein n=1 Tax=Ilex paraguariensis TaxID=185542 RepID=A0ABC8R4D0_9AQUA
MEDSTVCTFRLSASDHFFGLSLARKCVNYAICHNVQELDISCIVEKSLEFPPTFFTCQSIRVLKLRNCDGNMIIPKSFSLPALKTLYLYRASFIDDDCLSNPAEPFSRFPNIERLTLRNCQLSNSIIYAPKVRYLEILFRGHRPMFSSESKIVLSTPRLSSFKFTGQVSLDCFIEDLPCLDKIYVDLWTSFEEPYTDEVKGRMPLNLIKMLGQLRNAKSVTLSLDTLEVVLAYFTFSYTMSMILIL